MAPGSYDIMVIPGTTVSETWTWYQSDGTTLVDLTGYSAELQARCGNQVVDTYSTTSGQISLGGVSGTITLTVAASVTKAYKPRQTGIYLLNLTDSQGTVVPFLTGRFVIQDPIIIS